MAVLKRFSYDNIVEHNPTAPDPVEGSGGGEGTPNVIFGGYYEGTYHSDVTTKGLRTFSMDRNVIVPPDMELPEGYTPIAVINKASMPIVNDRLEFRGFNVIFGLGSGVPIMQFYAYVKEATTISSNEACSLGCIVLFVKGN